MPAIKTHGVGGDGAIKQQLIMKISPEGGKEGETTSFPFFSFPYVQLLSLFLPQLLLLFLQSLHNFFRCFCS